MMKSLILVFVLYTTSTLTTLADEPPFSFLLASSFDPNRHSLDDYLISEKLDGVRAYWNGESLVSRGGHRFAAPTWFLNALPNMPLDGELWGGRQTFDEVSGVVRRSRPHEGWHKVRFMVFELPHAGGEFLSRYQALRKLHAQHGNQIWQIVEQKEAPNSLAGLQALLIEMDAQGSEGLMLKSKMAAYQGGRSDDLLKVKLRNDAEALVVAHHKGKGRLSDVMGSITVQMPNGILFKIGSGFSDVQRKNPPAIGTSVTYKYNGLTKNGKPRFPIFWRVRRSQSSTPD